MAKEKDITEKLLLNCNDVFADVVNALLCNGEPVVDQKDLTDCAPTSQFRKGGQVHEQERDVAKYWTKAGARIAIFGVENQSQPDADMPLRIIGYDGASYKEQSLQHDAAKKHREIVSIPPYPAITIVINYGRTPWNQPKSLLECIGEENIPPQVRPYFNDYKVFVFDVMSMGREDIEKFTSDFKIVAQILRAEGRNEPYVPTSQTLIHPDKTLKVISALTQDNKLLNAYDDIVRSGYEGGIDMCRITTEIEERGIKRGIKRGEEQTLNVVAGIVRAYHKTGSVAAAAKANDLTEEYTRTILQKLDMLPS